MLVTDGSEVWESSSSSRTCTDSKSCESGSEGGGFWKKLMKKSLDIEKWRNLHKSAKKVAKSSTKSLKTSWMPPVGASFHEKKSYRKIQKHVDVVHQMVKLPWPIAPRELLIQRNWEFDADTKTVTMLYHSIEDRRIAHQPDMIRSLSPHMMWKFTAGKKKRGKDGNEDEDTTAIEIECFVDPRGSIPAWFINFLQQSWPTNTLLAFQTLVIQGKKKKYPQYPKISHW